MMDAQQVTYATETVAQLEAATFSLPFFVRRAYVPIYQHETDGDSLIIFVLQTEITDDIGTREDDMESFGVQIGIYQAVDPLDVAKLDELFSFAEQVRDFFRSKKRQGNSSDLTDVKVIAPFNPAKLLNEHTFVSLIGLTYMTMR